MELMSPMFLCTLVALLPQALGKSRKYSLVSDLLKNEDEKQLYITNSINNFNATSNINKVSDLQFVFKNPICQDCHKCMEMSIKAHKVHTHDTERNLKTNDIPNEINNIEEYSKTHRNKQNLGVDTDVKIVKKSAKKSKTKKSKNSKSFSVTKYSNEGKVYSLKVRETRTPILLDLQNQTKPPVSKCQVYRVTDSFPCNSLEAELILSERRTISKPSNKQKRHNEMSSSNQNKDKTYKSHFRHSQLMDESQVPENFMPSIEEMY